MSCSKALYKYDMNGKLVAENKNPFEGYSIPSNHIGDIDVYNGEIYVGAENFMDGVGKDIQIAIHDANTLKFKRTFKFEPKSGQEGSLRHHRGPGQEDRVDVLLGGRRKRPSSV